MVKQLTDFGKDVKIRLIELGQTQEWLIRRVRDRTGLYFDGSYLHKIITGAMMTPKIVASICEVLDLQKYDDFEGRKGGN